MAKVLVAIPTFDSVHPETFQSLWDMDKCGHEVGFRCVRGYDVAKARNTIVEEADGWDYILMVDSDMIVPKDALRNMLSKPVDLVLGIYPRRRGPEGTSTILKWSRDWGSSYTIEELKRADTRVRVMAGGFGCALLDTSVLSKLPRPYFNYVQYSNGDMLSEDYFFCKSLCDQDCIIEADTRVRCGHILEAVRYE